MKRVLVAILIATPWVCGAQGLLDFRRDLAFEAATVESLAERTYRTRVRILAADGRLDTSDVLLNRLRKLVERLRPAAQIERPDAADINWEIHTCRRCGENASAMAGGKLLVGEEFIAALALDDDELGYLLAHEMAHVLAEHTREFATTARFFLGNGRNREYWDIQNELDESFVENLRMAPLIVQQEFEADYIGYTLGARGGFDPEAMIRMLRKLPVEPMASFTFHARPDERIQRAQSMLESARRIREIGLRLQ